MNRFLSFLMCLATMLPALADNAVVVDATTGAPVAGASVFNRKGALLGICSAHGVLPYVPSGDYPLTIRCIGYCDASGIEPTDSIVRMSEAVYDLPEVVVEAKKDRVLHMLALVRDYSTLSTYTDTVTLFREKWVDFMVPVRHTKRFAGWLTPRLLSSKSYFRFTDNTGLDSVSDRCNQHFSWSDWIKIVDKSAMPARLSSALHGTDTVYGKYSPTEIWTRKNDDVTLKVDVLADTMSRKWVTQLSTFFRNNLDFENFRIAYDFRNVAPDTVFSRDLSHITCNIESRGRGHNMFMFNRRDEPFFVSTYTEIFFIDKRYIPLKEARKWEKHSYASAETASLGVPPSVPPVSPEIDELICRVDNFDRDRERSRMVPDKRLAGKPLTPLSNKEVILKILKNALGF